MNLVSNAAVYSDTPVVSSSQQNSTGGSSDLLGELGDFMGAPVASQPSSTSSSQPLQSTQQVRGPSRQTKSEIQVHSCTSNFRSQKCHYIHVLVPLIDASLFKPLMIFLF